MSSVVPEGWQVSPLGSLAIVNWGNTSLTKDNYAETGFPAYSAAGNDGLVPNAEHTDVGVVLSAIGARCGRTFLTPQKWTAIKNTITILSDNQDIRFLYQVFNFSEVWNKSGGAQPFISLGDARKTPILHPPLPEQKKIASILTSVDEVIENTQKQIDKLQDLKKATMNELLTKGIGHTEFKDSELGRIPKSWDVKTVGSICKLSSGGTPDRSKQEYWGGDIPWIKTGEINYSRILRTEEKITSKGLTNSSAKIIPKGAVVMAMYGQGITRGRVALLGIDATMNQACLAIIPNGDVTADFLYFSFYMQYESLRNLVQEGAQKNLSAGIVKEVLMPIPKVEEQEEISSTLKSVERNIFRFSTKLSQTESLKKSLMQDLLTGKVRVTVN